MGGPLIEAGAEMIHGPGLSMQHMQTSYSGETLGYRCLLLAHWHNSTIKAGVTGTQLPQSIGLRV